MESIQENLKIWKSQYDYCVKSIEKYDNGESQIPTTIQAFEGPRQDFVLEANYAAKKLKELGVSVPIVS